jgi:hypothetical protein
MNFLTLNLKGLANLSKKFSPKRLIENINPSIILLQEIMSDGRKSLRISLNCLVIRISVL